MVTLFKLPLKNRRKIQAAAAATGFVLAAVCAPLAPAANLTWDTNGAAGWGATSAFGDPATGTWDNNNTANWTTSGNYGTRPTIPWQNGNGDTAIFATYGSTTPASTAGTVTLASPIQASGITLSILAGTGSPSVTPVWTIQPNAAADTLSTTTTGGNLALTAGTFGSNSTGHAILGVISAVIADNNGSSLSMAGNANGKIALTSNELYTGATTVNSGTLSLAGTSGTSAGTLITTNGVTVQNGGTFNLDDSAAGAAGVASRFGAVTFNSGSMSVTGNLNNNTADSSAGALIVNSGASTLSITPGSGEDSSLTFTGLTQTGGSLAFIGTKVGSPGTSTTSHFFFTTAPTLTGNATLGGTDAGVLGYATVYDNATGGTSLATYDTTAGIGIRGLTAAEMVNDTGTANPTLTAGHNILLTADTTTAAVTVNSMTLQGGSSTVNITLSGTLKNSSNGFLSTGSGQTNFEGGTIALGNTPGYFHVTAGTLNIDSSQLTGTAGFVKDGPGALVLHYNNFSGLVGGNIDIAGGYFNFGGAQLHPDSLTLGDGPSSTFIDSSHSIIVGSGGVTTLGTATAGGSTNTMTATIAFGGAGLITTPYGTNENFANVTGANGLTVVGAGTIGLNGNLNGLSGGLTVGVLNAAGPSVTLDAGGSGYYSGNTIVNSGSLTLDNTPLPPGFDLTMNGGTVSNGPSGFNLTVNNFNGASGAVFAWGNNPNTLTVTGSGTFAGVLSGQASLSKTTGGILTLSGNNSYSGTTTITGGTLAVSNTSSSASGTGSGPVTVGDGTDPATLAGTGYIRPGTDPNTLTNYTVTVNSGATVSPGNSVGTLHITANGITWHSGSTFAIDLGGTTGSPTNDLLAVTGIAAFDGSGTITVRLSDLSGGLLDPTGQSFTILTDTVTPTGVSGTTFLVDDTGTSWMGGSISQVGNNLVLSGLTPASVPEPASLALLALGGLGLVVRRRKHA